MIGPENAAAEGSETEVDSSIEEVEQTNKVSPNRDEKRAKETPAAPKKRKIVKKRKGTSLFPPA